MATLVMELRIRLIDGGFDLSSNKEDFYKINGLYRALRNDPDLDPSVWKRSEAMDIIIPRELEEQIRIISKDEKLEDGVYELMTEKSRKHYLKF